MVVKKLLVAVIASTFLILGGCVAHRAASPPLESDVLHRFQEDGVNTESLFKGDAAVLSDADIARILASPAQIARSNRIAVMKLGTTRYWSEDHAKSEQQSILTLLDRLRSAPSVTHAAELPQLLVPDKKTVPHLREAAARYRADLLLVYDTRVRTFTKYRGLGKDVARALCSVEAVLLDVRTGIVPFTTSGTEEVSATRVPEDLEFSETVAKAVAAAEGRALLSIANDTVSFLTGKR